MPSNIPILPQYQYIVQNTSCALLYPCQPSSTLSPHPILNLPTRLLNLPHQPPSFHQLRAHVIHRLLQHYALTPALPLQSRYQFRQSIEAFADCLSAFLFCQCNVSLWRGDPISSSRRGKGEQTRSNMISLLLMLRQSRLFI
jgi:hypothetical protein